MARQYTARYGKKGMDLMAREREREDELVEFAVNNRPHITVDISLNTVLLVLGILLGAYLGVKLLHVISLVFFAFILSSAALPFVRWFSSKGLNKGISVALTYLLWLAVMVVLMMLVFVPFVSESQKFIKDLPEISKNLTESLNGFNIGEINVDGEVMRKWVTDSTNNLTKSLTEISGQGVQSAITTLASIAGGVFSLILIVLMSVYIIFDHDNFVDLLLLRIVDEKKRKRVRQLVYDVESKLGNWLLGQATLSLIIGVIVWAFLSILGLPFAVPLAVIAGLLEAIPNLGPVISAVPAVIIAFIVGGPGLALIVIIGYIVIQQLENVIIVPRIMSNAVGLRPVLVIIAVTSGFTLAGPIAALLAVPIAVLLQIAYEFYIDLQKLKAKGIV